MAAATTASAQPRGEAEVHYERAVALYTARNYEGALAEFQRSFAISGGADLLFNIGRCYQSMGRYPEAATAIEEYLRRAGDHLEADRRQEVTRILTTLRGFIAHLRVRVTPPDATVTLDGEAVTAGRLAQELAVGPGRHVVAATRSGYATRSEAVLIASGDTREVTLVLVAAAAEANGTLVLRGAPVDAVLRVDGAVVRSPTALPGRTHHVALSAPGQASWEGDVLIEPRRTRTLTARMARARGLAPRAFVGTAVATGAALIAGGVFGALTLSTSAEFRAEPRFDDDPDDRRLASRGDAFRAVTNVAFGLAAALGVASVVLFTQTRFGAGGTTVEVAAGPGGVGVRF